VCKISGIVVFLPDIYLFDTTKPEILHKNLQKTNRTLKNIVKSLRRPPFFESFSHSLPFFVLNIETDGD
jgi:hypothetical protein